MEKFFFKKITFLQNNFEIHFSTKNLFIIPVFPRHFENSFYAWITNDFKNKIRIQVHKVAFKELDQKGLPE